MFYPEVTQIPEELDRIPEQECIFLTCKKSAANRKQPAVPAHTSFFYIKVIRVHCILSTGFKMALQDGSG